MSDDTKIEMRWDAVLRRLSDSRPLVGAEVGVWRGELSHQLLVNRPKLTLWLIDPWLEMQCGYDPTRYSQENCDKAYENVKQICLDSDSRGFIRRKPSVEAAPAFEDRSLDFVFIDARHNYRSVRDDINAWLSKVRPGGWIGGHDYCDRYPGVCRAVNERFDIHSVVTDVDDTWFVMR